MKIAVIPMDDNIAICLKIETEISALLEDTDPPPEKYAIEKLVFLT